MAAKPGSKRLLFSFRSGSFRKHAPSSTNDAAAQPVKSGHHRRWSSTENAAALLSHNTSNDGSSTADEQGWFRSWRGRGGRPATHDGSVEVAGSNAVQHGGTVNGLHSGAQGMPSDGAILSQSPRPGCLGLLQRPGSGKYSALHPGTTIGEEHLTNGRGFVIWDDVRMRMMDGDVHQEQVVYTHKHHHHHQHHHHHHH